MKRQTILGTVGSAALAVVVTAQTGGQPSGQQSQTETNETAAKR